VSKLRFVGLEDFRMNFIDKSHGPCDSLLWEGVGRGFYAMYVDEIPTPATGENLKN